jgi:hypothetical protein
LVDDLEWPGLDVLLDSLILEAATDQTPSKLLSAPMPLDSIMRLHSLDIEDSVLGVHSSLVLCGLANQSLFRSEGDERWRGEATLLICNCNVLEHESAICLYPIVRTDFDAVTLVDGNTRVGGTYLSGQSSLELEYDKPGNARTQIDTDRAVVDFLGHDCFFLVVIEVVKVSGLRW